MPPKRVSRADQAAKKKKNERPLEKLKSAFHIVPDTNIVELDASCKYADINKFFKGLDDGEQEALHDALYDTFCEELCNLGIDTVRILNGNDCKDLVIPPIFVDGFAENIVFDSETCSKVIGIANDFGRGACMVKSVDLSPLKRLTHVGMNFLAGAALESIDLSPLAGLTSIGHNFLENTGIDTIDLAPLCSVRSIGHGFLASCDLLKTVDLAPFRNVQSIGKSFLGECAGLETVDITPLCNVKRVGEEFLSPLMIDSYAVTEWRCKLRLIERVQYNPRQITGGSSNEQRKRTPLFKEAEARRKQWRKTDFDGRRPFDSYEKEFAQVPWNWDLHFFCNDGLRQGVCAVHRMTFTWKSVDRETEERLIPSEVAEEICSYLSVE